MPGLLASRCSSTRTPSATSSPAASATFVLGATPIPTTTKSHSIRRPSAVRTRSTLVPPSNAGGRRRGPIQGCAGGEARRPWRGAGGRTAAPRRLRAGRVTGRGRRPRRSSPSVARCRSPRRSPPRGRTPCRDPTRRADSPWRARPLVRPLGLGAEEVDPPVEALLAQHSAALAPARLAPTMTKVSSGTVCPTGSVGPLPSRLLSARRPRVLTHDRARAPGWRPHA